MSKILPQEKNMTKLQTERKLHPSAEHKKNNYICAHKSDLLRKWKTLTGNYLNQRIKG